MKLKDKLIDKCFAIIFYQTGIGEFVGLILNYIKFKKYAFKKNKIKSSSKDNMEHYLIKQYHIIEKGLSLPDVRLGFGENKIKELLEASFIYVEKYGVSRVIGAISSTLNTYVEFNEARDFTISSELIHKIRQFQLLVHTEVDGGVKIINKNELINKRDDEKCGLIKTRHSIRVFAGPVTDIKRIKSAVTLGKMAPSVCNRQGWKAHYYNDKKVKEILLLQHGTTGFIDQINNLIIVTVDSNAFTSYEQNQQYIDGGLFSMNLMLGLHAENIAVCPLNACFPYVVENKIKKIADIPDSEKIVMFLALGEMEENFKVAVSARKDNKEILRIHK